jgi:hypothetical protein
MIAFLIAVSFQCVPVESIWDFSIPGRCISADSIIYAGAGLSIAEDIVIILLPVPSLKSLKLSLKKRLALIFMFAVGFLYFLLSLILHQV